MDDVGPPPSPPPDLRPRSVEIRLRTLAAVASLILVALLVGGGAFLYGKSTGVDLEAARLQGAQAGQAKGAAKGAARGYAVGLKRGRERGFSQTYPKSFKKSYKEAFENAGLEPPNAQDIAVKGP